MAQVGYILGIMKRYFRQVKALDDGKITPGEFARLVTGADGWWNVAAAFRIYMEDGGKQDANALYRAAIAELGIEVPEAARNVTATEGW